MDLEIIITALLGVATSFMSSWITWFFTRKKYSAEVDHALIENLKESLEFYQKLSDDNRVRLTNTLERSNQLENEVKELRKQVMDMMSMICTDMTCRLRKSKFYLED